MWPSLFRSIKLLYIYITCFDDPSGMMRIYNWRDSWQRKKGGTLRRQIQTHAKCVRVGNGCGGHTLNFMSWKRCTEMMSEVWEYRQRAKENNHTVVETPITGTKNCFLTIKQQLFFLFNNLCNFQNSWYCFANWNQDSIKAI